MTRDVVDIMTQRLVICWNRSWSKLIFLGLLLAQVSQKDFVGLEGMSFPPIYVSISMFPGIHRAVM